MARRLYRKLRRLRPNSGRDTPRLPQAAPEPPRIRIGWVGEHQLSDLDRLLE